VHGPFVFTVYETHARICLEANDLLEFGSCLSVLLSAYEEASEADRQGSHPPEFYGYAILRALLENTPKGTLSPRHLTRRLASHMAFSQVVVELLKKIGAANVQSPQVQHALAVAKAGMTLRSLGISHGLTLSCFSHLVQNGDYHKFFRLYDSTPDMGPFLIDHMLDPMRNKAVSIMLKAHAASFSFRFVLWF